MKYNILRFYDYKNMNYLHWNYFNAIDEDVERLSRYIEFHEDNMIMFSIETSRILMAATQEVDVLAKLLYKKNDITQEHEKESCDKCDRRLNIGKEKKWQVPRT